MAPRHDIRNTALTVIAGLVTLVLLAVGVTFTVYYYKYKTVVDERLAKPLFTDTAKIYAAPFEVRVGQKVTASSIAAQLRSAGYSEEGRPVSPLGTYSMNEDSITVHPGPQSYHSEESTGTISFANGKVSGLVGDQGQAIGAYELEPQLITGLSDANRGKRRLVTFSELPPNLVHAVVSIEDRRVLRAWWGGLFRLAVREGRSARGAQARGRIDIDDATGERILSYAGEES